MNSQHISLIHRLFRLGEERDLPLWLQNGWAIDARLHRVTRNHADIDIAYPAERHAELLTLLQSFGRVRSEDTDYGFLAGLGDIQLDCEPCHPEGDRYELEGPPPGTCPWGKEGMLSGKPVRCTSWEAILWDYFHYLEEVPSTSWKPKDLASYALARKSFGVVASERLHDLFKSNRD